MKPPKKPTLAQLKKRPALWVSSHNYQLRITYPTRAGFICDIFEADNNGDIAWWKSTDFDHLYVSTYWDFIGWL